MCFAMSNTTAFYTGGDQNLGELLVSYHEVFENPVNNNPHHTEGNLVVFQGGMNLRRFAKHRCSPSTGLQAKFREVG